MKKIISTLLVFTTMILGQDIQAQSSLRLIPSELNIWNVYNSLASESSSFKTTNTVKKITATSNYSLGSLDDSFAVLRPSSGGGSRFNTRYLSINLWHIDPSAQPLFDYGLLDESFVDYEQALRYTPSRTKPDSLWKSYNSAGQLINARQVFNHPTSSDFETAESNYTWDAQGRPSGYTEMYTTYNGGTRNTNSTTTYSSGAIRTITTISLQGGGIAYKEVDSIILSAGRVTENYLEIQGSPYSHKTYSYDAGGLLSKIETESDSNLTTVYIVSSRAGSDFPNSYTSLRILQGDTVIKTHGVYTFDSDGHLESFLETETNNNVTNERRCSVLTDTDGDITDIIWTDSAGVYLDESHFYYEMPMATSVPNRFDASVEAFPVPSSDYIQLLSSEDFDGYALYDVSGRLLRTSSFTPCFEKQIDLSEMITGIYLVEVRSDGKSKTIRIEKK